MKTKMKLVQVCDVPRTWLEVPADANETTVKRKYLKAQADAKIEYQRWTGKDYLTSH